MDIILKKSFSDCGTAKIYFFSQVCFAQLLQIHGQIFFLRVRSELFTPIIHSASDCNLLKLEFVINGEKFYIAFLTELVFILVTIVTLQLN